MDMCIWMAEQSLCCPPETITTLLSSYCGGGLIVKSRLILLWIQTAAHQTHLSMRFSREEYWSGQPFPSPGDLPDPGIEPASPALAGPVNRSLKRQTTLSYIPELIIKYTLSHRPTWHDLASSSSSPSRDNIDRQSEVQDR